MNKTEFIALVHRDAEKHGITIHLPKTKRVKSGGVLVSGVFDDKAAVLKVATKKAGWFPIFVHEYGHFAQWTSDSKIWKAYNRREKSCEKLFFPTAKLTPRTLQAAYEAVRNLELDCEKRTVALIKKYDLPIEVDTYIRSANAYVFFYTFLRDTRLWYTKKQPYKVKQIIDMMPTTFLTPKEYETLPSGYESLLRKFCLNKGD